MGLRNTQFVNGGGGGGNRMNLAPFIPSPQPLAGDFCVIVIFWQFGLSVGGYVPTAPVFSILDTTGGNNWVNIGDVFDGVGGPGGPTLAQNAQASLSVWFCRSANGLPMTIQASSTAIANVGDQQGGFSFQDWQLQTHGAELMTQKIDRSGTANPAQNPVNIGDLNQLVIASYYAPYGTAPILSSLSPGYTQMQGFAQTILYMDEYKVRPVPGAAQAPAIVTTATLPTWMMQALLIDINPPAIKVNQTFFPGKLRPLAIER